MENIKRARISHDYKSTKEKLWKTNTAVWFNKSCKSLQLTPNYSNIKISVKLDVYQIACCNVFSLRELGP
jgi:general stress protein 26